MNTLLHSLDPLWRAAALAYFEWAQREMDPLHPDAPFVTLRIMELRA